MEHLLAITLTNIILLGVLLLLQPLVRDIVVGFRYTISNFDNRVDEGVFANRLAMVCSNQIEAIVLWVPVVVVMAIATPEFDHPHLSHIGITFIAARFSYALISLAGIPLLRSAAWTVGFVAWAYLAWISVQAFVSGA